MSEPRKKNSRTPSKVPAVPGQYATPSRAGRRATETGSPLPKHQSPLPNRGIPLPKPGTPLPKAGRSTSLAINRSRDETFDSPNEIGTTPQSLPRSASASLSTPRHKRSQQERDLTNSDEKRKVRQEPPTKKHNSNKDKDHKNSGTWKYSDYLQVGHHSNWDQLQVWANVNGGGVLVLRAPVDKTPEDIVEKAWPQEFPLDLKQNSPYVALQMLEVKSGIAEYYKGDLAKATTETKRDLILEYLAATWEGREVRIFTEETPGTLPNKDTLVGTHRQHGRGVNVYAVVSNDTVRFRIHQQDNKHLRFAKKAVDFDDIAFEPAYQRDTPEETKAYLLQQLSPESEESPEDDGIFWTDGNTVAHELPNNVESPEKDEDTQSILTIDSGDTRIVVLGQEEDDGLSQALQDFQKAGEALKELSQGFQDYERAGEALKAEILKRERALLDRHDDVTREKERVALLEHSIQKKHDEKVCAEKEQSNLKIKELIEKENRLTASEQKLNDDVRAKKADWQQMETEFKEEENRFQALKVSLAQREKDLKEDRDGYYARTQASRESLKERQTKLDQREAAINAKEKLLDEREKAVAEKENLLKARELVIEKKEREVAEKDSSPVKRARIANPKTPPMQVMKDNTTTPLSAPLRAGDLEVKLKRKEDELAVYKTPYKLRLDPNTSFSKSFQEIPAGNPNAGMFSEITHSTVQGKGKHHNKTYEQFRLLQFPYVAVDGKLMQTGYEYEGHKYSVYEKAGKTKMVQDFEPGMTRRHQDGRLLISWNCLVEKEQKFTI